jgi:hypothetical protein
VNYVRLPKLAGPPMSDVSHCALCTTRQCSAGRGMSAWSKLGFYFVQTTARRPARPLTVQERFQCPAKIPRVR